VGPESTAFFWKINGNSTTIVDPVTTALRNASLDDEPETAEEKAAVSEARQ